MRADIFAFLPFRHSRQTLGRNKKKSPPRHQMGFLFFRFQRDYLSAFFSLPSPPVNGSAHPTISAHLPYTVRLPMAWHSDPNDSPHLFAINASPIDSYNRLFCCHTTR
jgi:hypothetical protein